MESRALSRRIAEFALNKKAEGVLVLDVRQSSLGTDWFLICSGSSDVHVKAIADEIVERLKDTGERVWRMEGYAAGRWILLDYVDVVVHVFHRETREYFGLELLWGDVPSERVEG